MSLINIPSSMSPPSINHSVANGSHLIPFIPQEILVKLCSYLNYKEAIHFGLANKRVSILLSDLYLWSLFLQKDFPISYVELKPTLAQCPALYKQLAIVADHIEAGEYQMEKFLLPNASTFFPSFAYPPFATFYDNKLLFGLYGRQNDTIYYTLNLKTKETTQLFKWNGTHINYINICNGMLLSASSSSGTIAVWNLETGKMRQTVKGDQANIDCVTIDNGKLFSASRDGTIAVWDLESGEELKLQTFNEGWPRVRIMIADHGKLFVALSDDTIKIWDLNTAKEIQTLVGHEALIVQMIVRNGQLISETEYGTIRIWDPDTGKNLQTLYAGRGYSFTRIIAWENMLMTTHSQWCGRTRLKIWNLHTREVLQEFDQSTANQIVTFYEGKLIAFRVDKWIKIWDFNLPFLSPHLPALKENLAHLGIVTEQEYREKLHCFPKDLPKRGIYSPEDLQILMSSGSSDFQHLEIPTEENAEDKIQAQKSAFEKHKIVYTMLKQLFAAAQQKSEKTKPCVATRAESDTVSYEISNPWPAFQEKLNIAEASFSAQGLTPSQFAKKFSGESYAEIVTMTNALIDEFRAEEQAQLRAYLTQPGILRVWNNLRDEHNIMGLADLLKTDYAPHNIFQMG